MCKIKENRLYVAKLINLVLVDKISVLQAVTKFPRDKGDFSIKCAFDALMHREADEYQRRTISNYARIQDEYLLQMANFLSKNQSLPKNVMMEYYKFHKDDLISDDNFDFKSFFKKVKRMINF